MMERLEFDMFHDVADAVQYLINENPDLEHNGFLEWDTELWVTGRYRRDRLESTKQYYKFPAGTSLNEVLSVFNYDFDVIDSFEYDYY